MAHGAIFFLRKNTVFSIALAAAIVTSVLVPPDSEYIGYFDFKTLTCLFTVLAVVCALRNIRFFTILAESIVRRFKTMRMTALALVYITFIGSMLIANDMALLTFLPLGWMVLEKTGRHEMTAFLFIMQNIAANLGGMLTPFGNPQNLYLYSHFSIPTGEFMAVMAPPFAVAVLMLTLLCLFVKNDALELGQAEDKPLPKWRTVLYLVLFALAIAIVFRGIPWQLGLIIIPPVLLFADREALKAVDYPLLLTFTAFFIFSGNMARLPAVSELIGGLLEKNTLPVSIASCQFISNVPSAILLSRFTEAWQPLLLGVNIGGTGTLISSLASLITFAEYRRHGGSVKKYLLMFTG
nr:citrate transporter [Clostridia bacterium]